MNTSSDNASAAAVASIVSGAVINALGLHSSSNSCDGCGGGPVICQRKMKSIHMVNQTRHVVRQEIETPG